jgi:antitoxin component of MazEF toxin-antitoxin module
MDKRMGGSKAVKIPPELRKTIKLAKFIQECDRNKQSFLICKSRSTGYAEAFRLARNYN